MAKMQPLDPIPILITRPQPGGSASARKFRLAGFGVHLAPLFRVQPQDWHISADTADMADAVLWTSANALRMAAVGNAAAFAAVRTRPALCVGPATAGVVRVAGMDVVHTGSSGVEELLSDPANAAYRNILWLCGTKHTPISDPRVTAIPCYDMQPVVPWPGSMHLARGRPHIIPLYSTATAQRLAQLVPLAERSRHSIAAISTPVALAAGAGWGDIRVASAPDDPSLLALCRILCQKYGYENG